MNYYFAFFLAQFYFLTNFLFTINWRIFAFLVSSFFSLFSVINLNLFLSKDSNHYLVAQLRFVSECYNEKPVRRLNIGDIKSFLQIGEKLKLSVCINNKTGLQSVSRLVEQVPLPRGLGVCFQCQPCCKGRTESFAIYYDW